MNRKMNLTKYKKYKELLIIINERGKNPYIYCVTLFVFNMYIFITTMTNININ